MSTATLPAGIPAPDAAGIFRLLNGAPLVFLDVVLDAANPYDPDEHKDPAAPPTKFFFVCQCRCCLKTWTEYAAAPSSTGDGFISQSVCGCNNDGCPCAGEPVILRIHPDFWEFFKTQFVFRLERDQQRYIEKVRRDHDAQFKKRHRAWLKESKAYFKYKDDGYDEFQRARVGC